MQSKTSPRHESKCPGGKRERLKVDHCPISQVGGSLVPAEPPPPQDFRAGEENLRWPSQLLLFFSLFLAAPGLRGCTKAFSAAVSGAALWPWCSSLPGARALGVWLRS